MKFAIHRFDSVSSTNDVALQMADASEGTVVIAGEQTAGRGRHGRAWCSPPGGLYLSVVLRPNLPFERLWQTAFVASLAAAEAIRRVSGLDARIKWPNDVLLNGRKVCGILVETGRRGDGATGRPGIVGIGINVNNRCFAPDLTNKATSIAIELGHEISTADIENALLFQLDQQYSKFLTEGFPPLLEAWRKLDCTVGRQVEVSTSEGVIEGTAVEVDSNGDLVVERPDGATARIAAGEVILL